MSSSEMNLGAIRDYLKANGETPANIEAMESLLSNITANGNVSIAAQKATSEPLLKLSYLVKEKDFLLKQEIS